MVYPPQGYQPVETPDIDSLTLENQGAGSDPVLDSDSASKDARLSDGLELSNQGAGANPVLDANSSGENAQFSGGLDVNGRLNLPSGDNIQDGGTDAIQFDGSGNVTVPNNATLGGDLDHDGTNIGFFGTTPTSQTSAYSTSNVTTDRSYDADSTTTDELADVLGTVISDLQGYGLLG